MEKLRTSVCALLLCILIWSAGAANVYSCWIFCAFDQRQTVWKKIVFFQPNLSCEIFRSSRIRTGYLIVSRHWRPAEWVLAQVTSAWLEGTYGNELSVTLDTVGDGHQSSGPTVTLGAMGIFSPPLKGTIEYIISSYSGEQISCGSFQEIMAEDCFKCNNCSLAIPSLEVTSQVNNNMWWHQSNIRDEVNSTHIDSDKLITQPPQVLAVISIVVSDEKSNFQTKVGKVILESALILQHGISKGRFQCVRTMGICQRYDLILWSL